jgi:TolB protein
MLLTGLPDRPRAEDPALLDPVLDAYASPSPDGRSIVYHSNRLGRRGLFIADADGRNPRLLVQDNHPSTPAWSPDGRWIAFTAQIEGDPEIHLIRPDGSGLRRLTDVKGDDAHPAWAADGRRLFFSSNRHTTDPTLPLTQQVYDIFSVDLDGGGLVRHTDCRAACTYPAPSPDGRRVAYRKLVPDQGRRWDQTDWGFDAEVFVSDLDGSAERNLTSDPAMDGWPAWSPDGRWIAIASNRDAPPNTGRIWLLPVDGGPPRLASRGDWSATAPRWSADSRRIYVNRQMPAAGFELGGVGVLDAPR